MDMILNLTDMWDTLATRSIKRVDTVNIKTFMTTCLDNNYRRGNNSLYWLQLFLNGDRLETAFKQLNKSLEFIEQDHGLLGNKRRGNYIPDFRIVGTDYTIDTKTFQTVKNFNSATNFENATFVIAFIMDEQKFYIRYNVANSGRYSLAVTRENLQPALQEILSEIVFPTSVEMIKFCVNKLDYDLHIPDNIKYLFNTYEVK